MWEQEVRTTNRTLAVARAQIQSAANKRLRKLVNSDCNFFIFRGVLNESDEGINDGLRGKEATVGVLLACAVVDQDTGTYPSRPPLKGGVFRRCRNVLKDGHQFAGLRPTMQAKGVRAGRNQVGRVLDTLYRNGESDGTCHKNQFLTRITVN